MVHSVSSVNGASIDTGQSPPFDTGAGKFVAASSEYLSIPDSSDWYFGTNDFTIDFLVKFNTLPANGNFMMLFQQFQDNNNYDFIAVYNNGVTYQWIFDINTTAGGGAYTINVNSSGLSTATWYHIAFVRSGNLWYMFQGGVQQGSTSTSTLSVIDYSAPITIGIFSSGSNFFDGWLKEVRVSKGVARWTSNFTPPTSEYSTDNYTKLLLHMDGVNGTVNFTDSSTTTQTLTLTFWVYPTSITGTQNIICKGRPAGDPMNANYGVRLNGSNVDFYYTGNVINNSQTVSNSSAVKAATSITVTSFTANTNYPIGTYVNGATTYLTSPLLQGTSYTSLNVLALPAAINAGTLTLQNYQHVYTTTNTGLTVNNWYYVVVSYQWPINSSIAVYCASNRADSTYADPRQLVLQTGSWIGGTGSELPNQNTYPLTLGAVNVDGTAAELLANGSYLDSVNLFNRTLTSTELYNWYIGEPQLGYPILTLNFEENASTLATNTSSIVDSSCYADNGTSNNLLWYNYNGIPNSEAKFGAVARYFDRTYGGQTEAQDFGNALLRIYSIPQRFVQVQLPLDFRWQPGQFVNLIDKSFRGRALIKEVYHYYNDNPYTELTLLYLK